MSIGHNGTTATIYNIGSITQDSIPSSAKIIAVLGSRALDGMLSNDSITDSDPNVNSNSKKDFAIPENFEGEITKSIREDILNGREDLAESKKKNVEAPKKKSTAQRAKSNAK